MKAATTTLHAWLGHHPQIHVPPIKEPSFFSYPSNWSRGAGWYDQLFVEAEQGQIVGEASTSYTFPEYAEVAADRIATHNADVKLIYIVRHPLDRLRSHYRHEVQRAREHRPLGEALLDPGNQYVARSCYFSALQPYIKRFDPDQLLVVKMEDLIGPSDQAWQSILSHLGVAAVPRPDTAHNLTEAKPQFTKSMLRIWESGWYDRLKRIPKPLRRVAKLVLTRNGAAYEAQLERSEAEVPAELVAPVWEDASRLEEWMGSGELWSRTPSAV